MQSEEVLKGWRLETGQALYHRTHSAARPSAAQRHPAVRASASAMADMVSARSLQVLQQNEKELILAEGGNRLAVLNRSERLAEEKERMLRECGPHALQLSAPAPHCNVSTNALRIRAHATRGVPGVSSRARAGC